VHADERKRDEALAQVDALLVVLERQLALHAAERGTRTLVRFCLADGGELQRLEVVLQGLGSSPQLERLRTVREQLRPQRGPRGDEPRPPAMPGAPDRRGR
jgi:hypothetical protein